MLMDVGFFAGVLVLVVAIIGVPVWFVARAVFRRPPKDGDPGAQASAEEILAEKSQGLADSPPGTASSQAAGESGRGADPSSSRQRLGTRKTRMDQMILGRFVIVAILAVVMLVPLALISSQIDDRSDSKDEAVSTIAASWGPGQTVRGPVLVIPTTRTMLVKEVNTLKDGSTVEIPREVQRDEPLMVLPQDLDVFAFLDPQERHLGLFAHTVYTASIRMTGTFSLAKVAARIAEDPQVTPHWAKAFVSLGLTKTGALRDPTTLAMKGDPLTLEPGRGYAGDRLDGVHAGVSLTDHDSHRPLPFEVRMTVNGSGDFHLLPVGHSNTFQVKSSWPHPGFGGNALPIRREISDQGFSAQWAIPDLARAYSQVGTVASLAPDLGSYSVGVSLVQPMMLYGKMTRATKYGILFIVLTFALFLAAEFRDGRRSLHPVQYLMVGFALSAFYLTLLALAEHIGFGPAYAIASLVNIGMVASYTGAAMHSLRHGSVVGGGLAVLYGGLYVILQQEDYALLSGTILLLVCLSLLMVVTRHLRGGAAPD